jgi:hypothetical protein
MKLSRYRDFDLSFFASKFLEGKLDAQGRQPATMVHPLIF